ncbi:Permease [Rubrivivax sp. A210]|uniref:AEC family transporter n=1 Tax=Rubrivivax sp. A210 TaxID=2772301 RepID=UPI00191B1265|nr:AEC family transporter [Rubrivivax sp. A210]CAD5375147.1 Permease [Rubrivivax sp. A210]
MLDILAITGPVYLVIATGYAATRAGLFAKAELRVLGRFIVNIALPAMLFNALSRRPIAEVLNPAYALVYLGATLPLIAAGWAWCRRRGLAPGTAAVVAMGISCPNSAYVGYPILLLILPQVAGVALALNMLIENVIVIPLLLALAESGRGGGSGWQVLRQSLQRLARNPMIIGLALGIAVSLSGLTPPGPLTRTVDLFAVTSGALSLFVIGGTLVGLPMRRMGLKVAPIAAGKLLAHPLLMGGLGLALPLLGGPALDPSLRTAALVIAAMPMMSIYPILAQAYGKEDLAAAALLVTTLASFFTLSGLLWLER